VPIPARLFRILANPNREVVHGERPSPLPPRRVSHQRRVELRCPIDRDGVVHWPSFTFLLPMRLPPDSPPLMPKTEGVSGVAAVELPGRISFGQDRLVSQIEGGALIHAETVNV